MGTKKEEIESGCLAKAAEDEPLFVLRGQDKLAPALVEMWASMAELHGAPRRKVAHARALAADMRDWPTRKLPD
jgi:hypothetical protein